MQVSYADQEDPKKALALPIRILPSTVEASRCEATEARIRSRCCGLVEIQEKKRRRANGVSFNLLCVGFLHKTDVEFLNIEHNWSTMLSLNSDQSFDPHSALMGSCLSFAKTTDIRRTANSPSCEGLSDIRRSFLVYAVMVENKTGEPQTMFVDEFQGALTPYLSEVTRNTIESNRSSTPKSSQDQILGFNQTILFLSLRFGLIRYITEKLDFQPGIAKGEQGALLLREALCQFIFSGVITGGLATYDRSYYSTGSGCQYSPKFWFDCVEMLLARDVDPNIPLSLFENRPKGGEDLCSSWEMLLDLAVALVPSAHKKFMTGFEQEDSWSSLFASLLKLLVIHGGEPNAVRVSRLFSGSALSIVERLLTPSWHVQAGPAAGHSSAGRSAAEAARTQLTSLLTERHAVQREWLGGKLITRPPLLAEADSKSPRKQTRLSVKDPIAGVSSPTSSSRFSPRPRASDESPRADHATQQRPRHGLMKGLWAKLTT